MLLPARCNGALDDHAQRTLRLCRLKKNSKGQTVWEGEVEVFDLHDHPKTHRVYAWAHETEDADHPRRHVTVLHIPPATSPRKAVQASIVSDYREQKGHAEN